MTDFMTLGQKIKHRREELGYTQVELAQKTQVSRSYISQLEKDSFNPSTQMIVNIAVVLDISIDYLLLDKKKRYRTFLNRCTSTAVSYQSKD